MDTEKARIYLEVIQRGSLSAAAEALSYTTSGIFRSMAALEEETGLTLLKRSRKGVEATAEGEALIPVFREMVHQDRVLGEKIADLKGLTSGTVTIGISYAGYFKLIAEPLKAFTSRYPGIRIQTLQAASTDLCHALEDHTADLAIMTYRESSMNFHKLLEDPMVACLSKDHPLASSEEFPLAQFEKEPFIAPYPDIETDYRLALKNAGIRPDIQYTTTDIYAAYCMAEAGLGVTLLNHLEVESWTGNIVLKPTDPPVTFPIGIMYPEEKEMTVAAKKFLEELTGPRG